MNSRRFCPTNTPPSRRHVGLRCGFLYSLIVNTWLVLPWLAEATDVGRFLWLSDIHLDPFYGTLDAVGLGGCSEETAPSLGQPGCDSPIRLLQETVNQAVATMKKNTTMFVIVTGDMCRHGTDQLERPMETTRAILANVSEILRESFGNDSISIIPSLGNNDVTPDYYLDVHDPTELLTMAAEALDRLFESDTERSTFLKGGYFARNVSDSLTVLSLNTVLYSTSHIPDNYDSTDDDPLGQFAWLQEELLQACSIAPRRIYLVGHIPPAMGSYRHSQLWKETFIRRYYSILKDYTANECIAGQFFGHLHADEFRWVDSAGDATTTTHWPLWLASSVTPIYGSNPSYRLVSYESSTGSLLDYDTYYLNLLDEAEEDAELSSSLEWKRGPSFRDSYQLPDLSMMSVQSLIQRLNQSLVDPQSSLWKTLVQRQHVFDRNDEPSCTDLSCRRAWICTLTTITTEKYADCLSVAGASMAEVAWTRWGRGPKERWTNAGVVFALSVSAMVAVCLMVRLSRTYLHRRHYQQHSAIDEEGNDDFNLDLGDDELDATGIKKSDFSTRMTESMSSSTLTLSYHEDPSLNLPLPAIS